MNSTMVGPVPESLHSINPSLVTIKLEEINESTTRPSNRSSEEYDIHDSKNRGIKLESNDELCRICLKLGEIAILGENLNSSEDLSVAISTFGGVEISSADPYPKFLCNFCNELLQGAILFRKTAQDTDRRLRNAAKLEPDISQVQDTGARGAYRELSVDIINEASEFTEHKFTVTSEEHPIEFDLVNDSKPGQETKKKLKSSQGNKTKGKKHPKSTDQNSEKKISPKSTDRKIKRITCPVCKKTLARNYYNTHKKMHESTDHSIDRMTCPVCKKSLVRHYYHIHMKSHESPTYICDICGKGVSHQRALDRHRLTHFFDLPLKCSFCPYRGRNKCLLTMHMRSHTGERPYICEQCPQRFISKSNLNRHMRTHTKSELEQKFKCDCGKSFSDKRNLESHIKVEHMGIKEHVCQICGNAYGDRKVLLRHERRVHKREKLMAGIKPVYLKLETLKQQEGAALVSES